MKLRINILLIMFSISNIGVFLACGPDSTRQQTSIAEATPTHQSTPGAGASEIPTVTYCELISNPQLYNEKVVRLHAYYRAGFESSYLYDPDCAKDKPPEEKVKPQPQTWLDFDDKNESCWRPALAKFHEARGVRPAKAEVIVVGKFYGTENRRPTPGGKYEFTAQCLEQIKTISDDNKQP